MKKLALLLALILAANPAFAALKGFSQSSTPTLTGPIFTGQASPTYAQGKLTYDTDNESLTFYNNDSNISLQIGQENWVRVINNSGSSIANGSAVKITGASGGLPTIALIQANASDIALGLITETLADGTTGYVTVGGLVRSIDTSAFSAGATLYVSSSVAGGLTATAPSAPNYRMRIGTVGVSNASTGTILVNSPTSGLGFGSANQVLGINSAATAQEYKTLAVGTSGTDFAVAHAANSVTFNLPDASATARGAVTTGAQTFAGAKTFSSTIVGSVNGNAATVTTNANLTGAVTSSGNATSLGSFSSANLLGALTDETGTGSAVFSTSPSLVTPSLDVATSSSIVVTSTVAPTSGYGMYKYDATTLGFANNGAIGATLSGGTFLAAAAVNSLGPVNATTSVSGAGLLSTGTKFTITGCTAGTTVGGGTAGSFVSGTTGTCTVVITMNGATGLTAANGWACGVSDRTTANLYRQTASSTTTATVSGTTVSGDVISFNCTGY